MFFGERFFLLELPLFDSFCRLVAFACVWWLLVVSMGRVISKGILQL